MAKICSVQVEILLTADEKALLDHYVKEQNQRYKKRGATRNWWTLEKLLQCLLSDIAALGLFGRNCRDLSLPCLQIHTAEALGCLASSPQRKDPFCLLIKKTK